MYFHSSYIDPSMMSNFDSISVLLNSAIYQYLVVPALEKRNLYLKTTTKFAIGIGFGALAIASAIVIDHGIHSKLQKEDQLNILWQIFPYFFVGAGEILTLVSPGATYVVMVDIQGFELNAFAYPTSQALSYDVAFKIAPKEQKGLASGINLFVMGCVSNLFCLGLQQSCASYFPDDASNRSDYMNSQLSNYLWILFAITVCGIVINLLPPVSNWLDQLTNGSVEPDDDDEKVTTIPESLSKILL